VAKLAEPNRGGTDTSAPAAVREVLVTWMRFDPDDELTGRRMTNAGLVVRLEPNNGGRTPAELSLLLRDAVGAIVSTDPFDRSVFAAAPSLRVIARVGVGTDSIDLEAATEAGVVVTPAPGLNTETTADHTLALMLAAVRRVTEHDHAVREGSWPRGGSLTPVDLYGRTVGLVGHGRIGAAVARRLRGFGVQLLLADPALVHVDGEEVVPLAELLARSDIVSLHLPLVPGTRGLIGAREIAAMKPGAILVNTARGGIVDEEALESALTRGHLRAAALDVFAEEPPARSGLLSLANVVLSPHIAGISVDSVEQMTRQATQSVLAVLEGAPDPAVVANPHVLERLGLDSAVVDA
jgi:phosphoglycerate dehydrogenase-like enzyme